MRVISGLARGRRLREPSGLAIRPTGDRVKEAIFNIIQFEIEGRRVLDLFSGTGQLGIEALSRGADSAVFADISGAAARLTRENIAAAGFSDSASVVRSDSLAYLENCERFGIIFLDPPYDTPLLGAALEKIIKFDKLSENGIIICESRSGTPMPDARAPYYKWTERRYGGSKLTLYRRSVGASETP
ncbi:MAG: 16S rRNA (guanine(966)-N(2))-methyltransferase RsmD [Oscillospiraceae bacterium]|jgi:16S rRNA (guanine(966)-N(2))-methyltransferase RsmD|nr:16S rRNA (guanine(966)-N(2))-methyltransferase RsmD [Oscillospiraceae bacterium]